jgi:galactose oxidase-like protein
MKGLRFHSRIEQQHSIKNLITRVKYAARFVFALVCLTSQLTLPGYCFSQQLFHQATTPTEANSWAITGSLNVARAYHTATLLSDGRVLVAGGTNIGILDSAELYDPVTGTWSVTGRLNAPRSYHTATLLRDGKVLVLGGVRGRVEIDGVLNSAELYDPQTGTWSVTGSLNTRRIDHTATLLQNGKVLVAGGVDGKDSLNHAELYDPDTGMWSFTGNLNTAIYYHTATLLQNGRVLVAVGDNHAEFYHPDTGTWTSVGNINGNYRVRHTATLLPNGEVLLAGGNNYDDFNYALFNTAELYDPVKRNWSFTGSLNVPRDYHTATLLPNGRILVAGGSSLIDSLDSSELYDPQTGIWSFTSNLNTPRSYHTATLLPDGKVLIVGGASASVLDSAELGYNFAAVPPTITRASVSGKKLIVVGENFNSNALILINEEEQKTRNDDQNPQTTLIGKKAGRKIKPGDKLQVRNPDGTVSEEFIFTGS